MAFSSGSTLQQPDEVAAVASASSGGGGGGTGIEVIQLDASGGDVTESLPEPSDGAQVLYIRIDDTSANTATIEDPASNDIYIFGETNAPTYNLSTRERVFLVSDGTNWYVEDFRGSSGVILDASNGNVTEKLPTPDKGRTVIALRVDDTSNSATLATANTASQEIQFPQGKDTSSVDLRPEQSLLLTADGTNWYVEEGQGLRAEAEDVTSDGGTKESPRLTQTATYDSDTTTGVTSSDVSIERYVRTDTDGNAVLVYEHDGTEIARLTDAGRLETRKDQEAFMDGSLNSGQGTNSLLQIEDGQGDVLTTDAASLQFTGSGVSVNKSGDDITVDVSGGSGSDIDIEQNQTPVVGGATGLSFEGSGIDDVTNDGDGTATVSISKGSSTEVQEGGTAQVTDVTVLDFVGGDFSVANPTSGEAEVSLGAVDADSVDGYEGSEIGVLAEDETVTGAWNFQEDIDLVYDNKSLILSVNSSAPYDFTLTSQQADPNATASVQATNQILFEGNSAGGVTNSGSIVWEGGGPGGGPNSSLHFSATTQMQRNTDGTQNFGQSAITIDSSEQVGIGTTSPNDKLHVTGGNIRLDINPDQFEFHSDASERNAYQFVESGTPKWDVKYRGDLGGEGLEWYDIASSTSVLYVERGGQVGIGTTTPSYALEVAGTAAVDTVRVDGYEFSKDATDGYLSVSEPNGDEVLRLTSDGVLRAAGDVVAFGLDGGGGTTGGGGFSVAGAGLTSPDGDTIEVDYGSGLTINNGILETDGSVGYSDSDAISAINNDNDHGSTAPHNYTTAGDLDGAGLTASGGQLDVNESGIQHDNLSGGTDADAHHAVFEPADYTPVTDVEGHGDALAIDITGDADTLDSYEGSDLAALAEDETVTGSWDFRRDVDISADNKELRLSVKTSNNDDFTLTTQQSDPQATANVQATNQLLFKGLSAGGMPETGSIVWEGGGAGAGPNSRLHLSATTQMQRNTDGTQNFDQSAITITSAEDVIIRQNTGLGGVTAPSYAVEVSGDVKSTGEQEAFLGSDKRLKTDITPLHGALDKIAQIGGYGFQWHEEDAVQPHKRGESDVGLIAQEVEDVLPEAVKEFQDGHSEGYKSVSYDKVVPLLVEAIKDLRSQVQKLQ